MNLELLERGDLPKAPFPTLPRIFIRGCQSQADRLDTFIRHLKAILFFHAYDLLDLTVQEGYTLIMDGL